MIRDAQLGLLETIPRDLLNFKAPVDPYIWESSRVFVSDAVPASERLRVQMQLIHEMVISARTLGATMLLGIIPEHSPRLARRVGLDCVPVGPVMDTGGMKSVCVSISLATKLH
jgi:N-acyl-L-homoserine lactone synthetase